MSMASYKGHEYQLMWIGQTKFGYRAHLQFKDGSKDFWVDGSLVSVQQGVGASSARNTSRSQTRNHERSGHWVCSVCGEDNDGDRGCWECGM